MEKEFKEYVDRNLIYGILSGIGGAVMCLYHIRTGNKFKVSFFIINVIIAGYIGIITKDFIPQEMFGFIIDQERKYALVSIIGFSAFPILKYIEKNGFKGLLDILIIFIDKISLILKNIGNDNKNK